MISSGMDIRGINNAMIRLQTGVGRSEKEKKRSQWDQFLHVVPLSPQEQSGLRTQAAAEAAFPKPVQWSPGGQETDERHVQMRQITRMGSQTAL